jgi:transposase
MCQNKERTNMKKKIEKYSSEFRKEAVRLALQTDQPKAVIADELGINRNTLYTWIQKAMQERVDLSKTKNQNISVKYQNLEEEIRVLKVLLQISRSHMGL